MCSKERDTREERDSEDADQDKRTEAQHKRNYLVQYDILLYLYIPYCVSLLSMWMREIGEMA